MVPKSLFGFDVVSVIGPGAGCTIYAVTDPAGQLFALKHVVRKSDDDDKFLQQLQNEYDSSRLFRHPALRKVIEMKTPKKFFSNKVNEMGLVLEWVDGTPLDQHVPADLNALLGIFAHSAGALASMHRLRMVHCDFKPHNVLICDDAKVKVIDFGQACKIGTGKQRLQGTPDYVAPEQVKFLPLDARTDVYSLGASLYWCLTGQKVPTYYNADKHKREAVKLQKFPSPIDLKPEIPQAISELAMQCVRYNPDQRPADMVEVLTVLEASLRATAAPAQPPAPAASEEDLHPARPKPRVVKDWGI